MKTNGIQNEFFESQFKWKKTRRKEQEENIVHLKKQFEDLRLVQQNVSSLKIEPLPLKPLTFQSSNQASSCCTFSGHWDQSFAFEAVQAKPTTIRLSPMISGESLGLSGKIALGDSSLVLEPSWSPEELHHAMQKTWSQTGREIICFSEGKNVVLILQGLPGQPLSFKGLDPEGCKSVDRLKPLLSEGSPAQFTAFGHTFNSFENQFQIQNLKIQIQKSGSGIYDPNATNTLPLFERFTKVLSHLQKKLEITQDLGTWIQENQKNPDGQSSEYTRMLQKIETRLKEWRYHVWSTWQKQMPYILLDQVVWSEDRTGFVCLEEELQACLDKQTISTLQEWDQTLGVYWEHIRLQTEIIGTEINSVIQKQQDLFLSLSQKTKESLLKERLEDQNLNDPAVQMKRGLKNLELLLDRLNPKKKDD